MPDAVNSITCGVCANGLVKNGRTAAGTQRWRCLTCGASATRKRIDLTRVHTLNAFVKYLLGKASQSDLDGTATGRSFRRRIAWCWDIAPILRVTGEVFDEIQLDGLHLRTGWCLLIASAGTTPIAFQWAGIREPGSMERPAGPDTCPEGGCLRRRIRPHRSPRRTLARHPQAKHCGASR